MTVRNMTTEDAQAYYNQVNTTQTTVAYPAVTYYDSYGNVIPMNSQPYYHNYVPQHIIPLTYPAPNPYYYTANFTTPYIFCEDDAEITTLLFKHRIIISDITDELAKLLHLSDIPNYDFKKIKIFDGKGNFPECYTDLTAKEVEKILNLKLFL